MSRQPTEVSTNDFVRMVATGVAGFGVVLLALFQLALPIVVLVTFLALPLAAVGLVLALAGYVLYAPVALVRRARRHRARREARLSVDHPVLHEPLALAHPARLVVGERVGAVEGVGRDLYQRRDLEAEPNGRRECVAADA
jgi:hypothetical protein